MAGVLQLSAVSIVTKHREWRSNEGCGQKGIFRTALNIFMPRPRPNAGGMNPKYEEKLQRKRQAEGGKHCVGYGVALTGRLRSKRQNRPGSTYAYQFHHHFADSFPAFPFLTKSPALQSCLAPHQRLKK